MHFAPEIGIAKGLVRRLGSRYQAYDFQPEIYAKAGLDAKSFDLCNDTTSVATGSVGAICHVHVLEHVRCNAAFVLTQLNGLLASGGYHIFGVPFYSAYFSEDLSPDMSNDDRLARFGHEDHVRSFGSKDFEIMFGPAFVGMERVNLSSLIQPSELAEFNVPQRALTNYNAHSLSVYKKN